MNFVKFGEPLTCYDDGDTELSFLIFLPLYVEVWAWQFGHNNVRLSNLLSLLIPFILKWKCRDLTANS